MSIVDRAWELQRRIEANARLIVRPVALVAASVAIGLGSYHAWGDFCTWLWQYPTLQPTIFALGWVAVFIVGLLVGRWY